jgi:hypothetical protein
LLGEAEALERLFDWPLLPLPQNDRLLAAVELHSDGASAWAITGKAMLAMPTKNRVLRMRMIPFLSLRRRLSPPYLFQNAAGMFKLLLAGDRASD